MICSPWAAGLQPDSPRLSGSLVEGATRQGSTAVGGLSDCRIPDGILAQATYWVAPLVIVAVLAAVLWLIAYLTLARTRQS